MKTDTEYLHEALENWRALPSSRGLADRPFYELPPATQSAILTEAQLLKSYTNRAEQIADGTQYIPVGDNA